MDQLEDSTLDLIYRRRVHSALPGYVIIMMIIGLFIALPLVEVDVVTSKRGMVRPVTEIAEVLTPRTGILDSTILGNNKLVKAGDTLAWIRRDYPEARIKASQNKIAVSRRAIHDIHLILEGESPVETNRFKQSYRNHLSTLSHFQLQKEFLHGEFTTAEKLFLEEVISRHEYEQAQSNFHIICAKETYERENYRNLLEEEMYRLELENSRHLAEIDLIISNLHDYYIIAPVTGTILNYPGINSGSVLHSGTSLGIISPSGNLVAECYIEPATIPVIEIGTRVKLRFDDPGFRSQSTIETVVDQIDKDVTLANGIPAYRIRCPLDNPQILYTDGTRHLVRKGMTFTASFVLFKRSIAALILEKANRWVNPSESVPKG